MAIGFASGEKSLSRIIGSCCRDGKRIVESAGACDPATEERLRHDGIADELLLGSGSNDPAGPVML
jgi:hypothetical protein